MNFEQKHVNIIFILLLYQGMLNQEVGATREISSVLIVSSSLNKVFILSYLILSYLILEW